MSVKITDICIACDTCLVECPVGAILEDHLHPNKLFIYYVQPEVCVECNGYNDRPACAEVCPTEGCIVWDDNVETEGKNPGEICFQ